MIFIHVGLNVAVRHCTVGLNDVVQRARATRLCERARYLR
jgi:hypothetical protein